MATVLRSHVQRDASLILPAALAKLRRMSRLSVSSRGSWFLQLAMVRALGPRCRSCRVRLASGAFTVDRVLKTAFLLPLRYLCMPAIVSAPHRCLQSGGDPACGGGDCV